MKTPGHSRDRAFALTATGEKVRQIDFGSPKATLFGQIAYGQARELSEVSTQLQIRSERIKPAGLLHDLSPSCTPSPIMLTDRGHANHGYRTGLTFAGPGAAGHHLTDCFRLL
ncbi:hypothetical protein LCGC14_2992940 [marine sediment metagenome]|uniref:Uncharacterized protein n=1 Tax=marine sediment metagenome TaxID=412755 RepID=A0A0F8ZUC5_9ZZZZ